MTQVWEITGVVEVEERATSTDVRGRPRGVRRPLAGITIDIAGAPEARSAAYCWGQTTTDADGRFSLRVVRPTTPHSFRISARLSNERLVITEGNTDAIVRRDWMLLRDTLFAVDG